MLSSFRTLAKSPFAYVLFGLLIVAFAVFGIRDVFHGKITDAVISAGSRDVSPGEFKREFNRALKQVEQQQGQPVSVQEAAAAGFDSRVLSDMATNEAFAEFVRRMGVSPADSLVGDAIAKNPGFFNSISGKFDRDAYTKLLSDNQLTPAQFESLERDDIAQRHVAAAIGSGMRAPRTYGAVIAGYEFESRALTFFILDPRNVVQPTTPTDAQLQAFLNEHAADLKLPERRVLSVVRFSAKALTPSMPVDPTALQKLYEFRKDTASSPEQRSLVQIPVKDAATAASVAAKLRQGADPAAVAKGLGVQPIVYDNVAKSAIADPKIADAAFAMKAGEVSGPIQGGLGVGVIKLGAIKPAHQATLDEMRAQLEAQVRADAAVQKVFDQTQKYEDAHSGGANLADSAKAVGASVMSIGPITSQGADLTGQPVQGLSQKLMVDAFKLPQGGESDMENEGSGEYFAVRVEKVLPPAVPSLAEIKPRLLQAYMVTEMNKRLQAKADELTARVKKGESLETVAASISAPLQHAASISRASLAQNRSIGQEMAAKIFTAKAGEVFSAPTAQVAVMVARLDGVQPPAPMQAALLIARGQEQLSSQLFEDVGQMMRTAAVAKIKPTTDLARARLALGLSPDSLPQDGSAKSGAAPAKGTPAP
jgi:peptidyl-prolyl cis-trans isomerase D